MAPLINSTPDNRTKPDMSARVRPLMTEDHRPDGQDIPPLGDVRPVRVSAQAAQASPARKGRKRGRNVYVVPVRVRLDLRTEIALRALANCINGHATSGNVTQSDLVRRFIQEGVANLWSRLADGTETLAEPANISPRTGA